jgi:hypothetical protein
MRNPRLLPHSLRLLAIAVAVGLLAAPAQGQTKLRWQFKKGQKFNYTLSQKSTTTAEAGAQKQTFTSSQVTDVVWEIRDVDSSGTADMVQTIRRIRVKAETPYGPMDFDSKGGQEPQGPAAAQASAMRAMIDASVSMKMSPRGEISDIMLSEKMVQGLKNTQPDPAARAASEESMKKMMSQATLVLPAEPIARGKTWSTSLEVPAGPLGTMVVNNTYTYEGQATENGAKVEKIRVDVKVDIKTPPSAQFQAKIKSQDNRGSFAFDNASGSLKWSEITQKIQMAVSAMNQEALQGDERTVRMERTEPEASSSR